MAASSTQFVHFWEVLYSPLMCFLSVRQKTMFDPVLLFVSVWGLKLLSSWWPNIGQVANVPVRCDSSVSACACNHVIIRFRRRADDMAYGPAQCPHVHIVHIHATDVWTSPVCSYFVCDSLSPSQIHGLYRWLLISCHVLLKNSTIFQSLLVQHQSLWWVKTSGLWTSQILVLLLILFSLSKARSMRKGTLYIWCYHMT